MIKDGTGTLSIYLKGEWAEEAIKQLNRIGKWISLSGRGGTVEAVKDKKGNHVLKDDKWKTYRIVYAKGIEGNWGRNGKGSHFSFKGDASIPATSYSTLSTNPHARPSINSTSQHQRSLAKLSQKNPNQSLTLDEQVSLAVPDTNPENPYVGARSRNRREEGEGSSSSDGEGGASESDSVEEEEEQTTTARKKRKREKKETRKEWGMKTNETKLEYSTLDIVEKPANASKVNLIAIALVRREIYQPQKSKDKAIDLWLYDPTHTKAPARLCFFGPKEEHLPVVENGDILIVQNINYQKDRKQLTAFGNIRNGPFLVIPSRLAEQYHEEPSSIEFVSQLPKCSSRLAKIGEEELAYARDLARWSRRFDVVGNHEEPGRGDHEPKNVLKTSARLIKGDSTRRELVEIRQLEPDNFYDVQGEIIKFYNREGRRNFEDNDVCQLFITDYTRNDQLMRYEDTSNVRLPGQYALQISIYGHQAKPLLKFNREEHLQGKFVHLRNVRTKLNENGLLEATMWIDQVRRDKSDVTIKGSNEFEKTPWFRDFSRRRDVYCNASTDSRLKDEYLTLTNQARIEATTFVDPFASPFDTLGLERQSMSAALSMPLAGSYLFQARVIDYKPDNLEDFAVAYCTDCQAQLSKGLKKCFDHDRVNHEFQFALVLQGEQTSTASSSQPPCILVEETFFSASPRQSSERPDPYLLRFISSLSPILGDLPEAKAMKRRPKESELGEWMEFVVEAWKDEEGKLRWKFDQERTLFVEKDWYEGVKKAQGE
ncbi:uncharacterized protein JCM6883_001400 [Sporobolomyces salmoneus]|uniref:uncharacterized protein n=1 Tax=Sporobolomyces salmoneus TaxID=183962 RepID=UPI00317FC44A